MINEVVVRILAERIMNKGENPLRKRAFLLDDVTNPSYRKAVEDYILKNSAIDTGILEDSKEGPKPIDPPKEEELKESNTPGEPKKEETPKVEQPIENK